MANQENKDFSDDVNESFQNGEGNNGSGDATENGTQESQEDR